MGLKSAKKQEKKKEKYKSIFFALNLLFSVHDRLSPGGNRAAFVAKNIRQKNENIFVIIAYFLSAFHRRIEGRGGEEGVAFLHRLK